MKIIGIEHIGIAVKELKTDAPFWKHILGINHTNSEKVFLQIFMILGKEKWNFLSRYTPIHR